MPYFKHSHYSGAMAELLKLHQTPGLLVLKMRHHDLGVLELGDRRRHFLVVHENFPSGIDTANPNV